MTEAQWLACEEPTPMFLFQEHTVSERKVRLFHFACCKRVEHLLVDVRSRRALMCVRRYAEGQAEAYELNHAGAEASSGWEFSIRRAGAARYGTEFDRMTRMMSTGPGLDAEILGFDAAANAAAGVLCAVVSSYQTDGVIAARYAAQAVALCSGSKAGSRERLIQCLLLRDIFGNPFRPVTFSPAWRTETTLSLAQQMYDSRDFGAMPILADALQDAGCDSEDILSHCRGDGTHVRGCWVVDLVLGREQGLRTWGVCDSLQDME